ncbi:AAR052Cp [Eremothecium gossypii ATCC 10895]|uniref:AAR052Cp n=1 Tax=Eremothecium gossypii (strain ATCC 10895 / CBS 109.51 / FGSC 9923 / NRRL Y-1056) TaxID=284811 RepID=Q75EM7_EREGS|nr:AAR052Cp [Eremothecium gossypii ATCC 10895]AAS50417.1 AAR052Cp [Eremothecium gossypii ATCC 10895]AEY94703.1 FAAR052Cp [Eremothecium gossypii FDAG1]
MRNLATVYLTVLAAAVAAQHGSHSAHGSTGQLNNNSIHPVAHESHHMHGMPILETQLTAAERAYWEQYDTMTYFNAPSKRKRGLWMHAAAVAGTALVLYPASLVLAESESRWYLVCLAAHCLVLWTGLAALAVYAASLPSTLYPGNVYGTLSWIVAIVSVSHAASAVVVRAAKWLAPDAAPYAIPLELLRPERSSSSHEHSQESIDEHEANVGKMYSPGEETAELAPDVEQATGGLRDGYRRERMQAPALLRHPIVQQMAERFGTVFGAVYRITNSLQLLLLLVYAAVGFAIGNRFAQGKYVFNFLAHWIKGGIFFLLGVLSLARYCGFGAAHGWAWNAIAYKARREDVSRWRRLFPQGTTMEGVESFLIFFYGSTNVFLEHLANPGGRWEAKDLQHVSIAFMYIGCGLCGLIVERRLASWRCVAAARVVGDCDEGSPGFSPNPFPALTVFFTGILMSQHAQASEVSTVIHAQWGKLLAYGSFFRIFTFLLLLLLPRKGKGPAHPFPELVTSFCLVSGGMIFMESTDQVIEALEYRGLTPMFTFNLSVGTTVLVMAWIMLLFSWRDAMCAQSSAHRVAR